MELEFSGEIWFWRGPAPWYFVTVPEDESLDIEAMSTELTYGWGVIPVTVQIGKTVWRTSLFPKDGLYIVPIKAAVRAAEKLALGDVVAVRLATAV
jgi:Domain of unknown function (DUF1905)